MGGNSVWVVSGKLSVKSVSAWVMLGVCGWVVNIVWFPGKFSGFWTKKF